MNFVTFDIKKITREQLNRCLPTKPEDEFEVGDVLVVIDGIEIRLW